MGGLKAELAAEVRVYRPKTYTKAIEIARIRDDHLMAARRAIRPDIRRPEPNMPEVKTTHGNQKGEIIGSGPRPLLAGIKRLPWDELQKRRERGLCINCDEKFIPGHKCKIKQAYLIEPMDSGDVGKSEEITEVENAEISIQALADVRGPRTKRLNSWIKNRRVVVLVDNGSSHNFINQEIAQKLNLGATTIEPFQVRVASGEWLSCMKMYRDVPIRVQGFVISADLFELTLGGIDVVLGVQWLERLGRVVTDYRRGIMEFQWGDKSITLRSGTNNQFKKWAIRAWKE